MMSAIKGLRNMKLHILSDLHLSCVVLEHPRTDADVVILAGDIARPQEAIAQAQRLIRDFQRIHADGHTHDSFDYPLGATRVVCNPRGYSQNGVNENPAFNPSFQLEVAC